VFVTVSTKKKRESKRSRVTYTPWYHSWVNVDVVWHLRKGTWLTAIPILLGQNSHRTDWPSAVSCLSLVQDICRKFPPIRVKSIFSQCRSTCVGGHACSSHYFHTGRHSKRVMAPIRGIIYGGMGLHIDHFITLCFVTKQVT
jgi:hypothetical protein